MRRIVPAVVTATALAFAAGRAYGQQAETGSAPEGGETAGLTVTPYVSLATVYDDNIFSTASQTESDTILRLTPGLVLDYGSPRTQVHFSYRDDAERYSRHSDLNSWQTRQSAQFASSHAFSRQVEAGLDAAYFETYYPGELTPVTGVEVTRTRATAISFRPRFVYHFDSRTSATAYYSRERRHVAAGLTSFTTTASAALERDVTRRDTLALTYQFIWFDFSGGTSPLSRVATLGWHHALSRRTSFFLAAGPRDTDGRTVAEISAGIRDETDATTAELTYTRSQFAVAGLTGVYDTHAVQGLFEYRITPRLTFDLVPGYYRNTLNGQEAEVYRLGLGARYWFARAWSVALTYDYGRQRGVLGAPGNNQLIRRNVAALALTWALPQAAGPASIPQRSGYRPPARVFEGG